MKKLKKAVVSCALAVAMTVAGGMQMVAPLSTSASVITPVQNSAFQYDIITKELSRTGNVSRVKFTIRIQNNPYINSIYFLVKGGDSCTVTGYEDPASDGHFMSTSIFNSETGRVGFVAQKPTNTKYEFSVYMTVNNITNANQIKVEVHDYKSDAEGIESISRGDDATIPVTTSAQMVLGDTNNNNIIEQLDAYNTLCAVNNYSGKLSVNYLRTVKNTGTWQNLLPELKFAEAMDVNFDGYITQEDASAILTYNSHQSLGQVDTTSPIGKVYYVNL